MVNTVNHTIEEVWKILAQIPDPEIPVITITDLGIVRDITLTADNHFVISITPTYSGCPATDVIAMSIKMAMLENGITNFSVQQVLSPAWTTDWITPQAKQKLNAYGIAPPNKNFSNTDNGVPCPQCQSTNTVLVSEFGSTPCKSLYKCNSCKEPFDYFKCH
jgi:ring-1,2-phenylacetyl-CoA epoxidase subunit PaaD